MTLMAYRGWVKVPGIDVESDDAGLLLVSLQERHASYGPVLSGADKAVEVVLSVDRREESEASVLMLGAVTDALISAKLVARPSEIRVERSEEIRQPA